MTATLDTQLAHWETYLEGPRWALPEGTIRKGIIDCGLHGKVELVYEQRTTSLTRATIFFKVQGPHRYVSAFSDAVSASCASAL